MSAGEGLHQRRFAVIDVTSGANNAHKMIPSSGGMK
jgi:hypothetical protein